MKNIDVIKKMYKIGIVGYGYVGRGIQKIFPDACIYDKNKNISCVNRSTKLIINECNLAIICVPTPSNDDGSCNISIVEESIKWIESELILIKSTIAPGTTKMLEKKYNKNICFSPEYMGESEYYTPIHKYPDPKNPLRHDFMIIGGKKEIANKIIDIFKIKMGPDAQYYSTDSKTAELCKYMENSWGSMKISFCNEFYNIAQKLDIDYNELRELWLLDSRINRNHTLVFSENRGFGGKCFPKDLSAIINLCKIIKYEGNILKSIYEFNKELKE